MKTTQKQHRSHTTPFWSLVGSLALTVASLGTSPASAQHHGFAVQAGSSSEDKGLAITRDSQGNSYVTGCFQGIASFGSGPATVKLASAGYFDIFVAKYDAAGTLVWAKSMGGNTPFGEDMGNGIAVDAAGNVLVTGWFEGTADFDPGPGTFNLTSAGAADIFVCKLNGNGSFLWAKRIGGTGSDGANAIALDAAGNVLTAGFFAGTVDFDPGAAVVNLTGTGFSEVFVSKLDTNGGFVWARRMGGSGTDGADGIAVDAAATS